MNTDFSFFIKLGDVMKNILFITGHKFGVEFLKGFLDNCHECEVTVLALHPRCSSNIVGFCDAKQVFSHRIKEIHYFESFDDAIVAKVFSHTSYEYCFCVGLSMLVPANFIKKSTWIGAHPTLLPIGRGRAPIPWTIIKGLKKTGLTSFKLAEKADNGPIIFQTEFITENGETSTSLFVRMEKEHYNHGEYFAKNILNNTITYCGQDESLAVFWKKRVPSDGFISTSLCVSDVEKLVRALQFPYPLPFLSINGNIFKILSTTKSNCIDLCTGEAEFIGENKVLVGFFDACLELKFLKDKQKHDELHKGITYRGLS